MATWTCAAYIKRLQHETKHATTERGIARLRATLRDVEAFLTATETDPQVDEWIALLLQYQIGADTCGLRHS